MVEELWWRCEGRNILRGVLITFSGRSELCLSGNAKGLRYLDGDTYLATFQDFIGVFLLTNSS